MRGKYYKGKYRKIPFSQYSEVRDRFRAGLSTHEIAEEYRCSVTTVHNILQYFGVPACRYRGDTPVNLNTGSIPTQGAKYSEGVTV